MIPIRALAGVAQWVEQQLAKLPIDSTVLPLIEEKVRHEAVGSPEEGKTRPTSARKQAAKAVRTKLQAVAMCVTKAWEIVASSRFLSALLSHP